MLRLLYARFGPNEQLASLQSAASLLSDLESIQLFETLVAETHAAALRTAAVASCVNTLGAGRLLISPECLKSVMPQPSSILEELPRCQKELRPGAQTIPAVTNFFNSLDYAQAGVCDFCADAEQWGAEQAAFLHLKNLSTVWRRVSQLALNAVVTLDADIQRCLPVRYGQNTAVLKKLLTDVLEGGQPCLDVNGQPYIPELPQRRPAARRVINKPCIVEHQGKAARASVKDISSSGLGLEDAPEMTPHKVALIEFEDGRCVAGVVVWSKGANAGIKFDTPLGPNDALLVG